MYTQTFHEWIRKRHSSEIADLTPDQFKFILNLLSAPFQRYRHNRYGDEGFIQVKAKYLEENLGRNYPAIVRRFFEVKRVHTATRIIEPYVPPYDIEESSTKAYKLRPEVRQTLQAYYTYLLEQPETGKVYYANKKLTRRKNAIQALDLSRCKTKTKAMIDFQIPINHKGIRALMEYLKSAFDAEFSGDKLPSDKRFNHIITGLREKARNAQANGKNTTLAELIENRLSITAHLFELSLSSPTPKGTIPQLFTETTTGRLVGEGINLQTTPKEIRKIALEGKGLVQYDIHNCHYVIFEQLAERNGINVSYVHAYNCDKNGFRNAIAEKAGITIPKAKQALIALIFGELLSAHPENALAKNIGVEPAKILINDPDFIGLYQDIKKARKAINENAPRTANPPYNILNAMHKPISRKEKPERILSHILQGFEAKALNAILETYQEDIILPIHDGFVSRNLLSLTEVERIISSSTGFDLKAEETHI